MTNDYYFKDFDNLLETHTHEEKLRAESLVIVEADEGMRKRLILVEKGMAIIFAYTHEHVGLSEDEVTIQMLGVRLFNAAASAIKLALSGYYQTAFSQARDIMETGFLVDMLRTSPEKIAVWKGADDAKRREMFSPVEVRKALDSRDGNKEKKRAKLYKILSETASHATYKGFQLTTLDGLGQIGPFVNEKMLKAWVEEMVLRLGPSAVVYAKHFPKADPRLLVFLQHFGSELVAGVKRDETVHDSAVQG